MVWHRAFYELLASIYKLSQTGRHVKCADGKECHVFPAILILSADFEEQYGLLIFIIPFLAKSPIRCYMTLVHGTNSNFPCPICLVPNDKLCDGVVYDSRTSESMQQVYNTADKMGTVDERETYLKGYSLRYAKVAQILYC